MLERKLGRLLTVGLCRGLVDREEKENATLGSPLWGRDGDSNRVKGAWILPAYFWLAHRRQTHCHSS